MTNRFLNNPKLVVIINKNKHPKVDIMNENEEISKLKNAYNYVIKISNSYKRISGLLTGFTLTSIIFLFSSNYEESVQFDNIMWIIASLNFTFFSLFFGVIGYYGVEGRAYGINFSEEYSVKEKIKFINKLETPLNMCHSLTGIGAGFLILTTILILNTTLSRAFDIFVLMIVTISIIFIAPIGGIMIFLILFKLLQKIKKHKK